MSILIPGNDEFNPKEAVHHEAGVGCCACGTGLSAGMVWWINAQRQMGMKCIGIIEICTCAKSIRYYVT